MRANSKVIFVFLLLLTTNLFGQDYDLLTKIEWMSISSGLQKHYLFLFRDGKIESEFIASQWNKYILSRDQISVFNNEYIISSSNDDSVYDTAIFKIKILNSDSLILEPQNLSAGKLSYYYNRKTHALNSNSFKTKEEVKFYNRQLSYQKIKFDSLSLNSFDKFAIKIDSKGITQLKKELRTSQKLST